MGLTAPGPERGSSSENCTFATPVGVRDIGEADAMQLAGLRDLRVVAEAKDFSLVRLVAMPTNNHSQVFAHGA